MLKIAIGTMNPTKVDAVKVAFHNITATFIPTSVESGVSSQPFSDEETIQGAINRAKAARIKADCGIGIGLEGGVVETSYGLFLCNWGALFDGVNEPYIAGGARILLPEQVARGVRDGLELGEVMDHYTKEHNVRHKEGAVGVFTNGAINRTEMFTHVSKLLVGQYQYKHRN
jgi:inosine/xanthosine triphosphatase